MNFDPFQAQAPTPALAAMDPISRLTLYCRRIFLRDHAVSVQIGAHDFEKGKPQRVIFNVELFVPYAVSTPQSDSLSEVVDYDFVREVIARRVDYDFVREVIARRVATGHVELQETLCDDLASRMLEHPQVWAVRLSSCKPDVYPDSAGVGVEVFRMKETA